MLLSDTRPGNNLRFYPDFNNNSYFHHTAVRTHGQLYIVSPTSPDFQQYYNTPEEWMQFHGVTLAQATIFADHKPPYLFMHELQMLMAQGAFVQSNDAILEIYNDTCLRYREAFPDNILQMQGHSVRTIIVTRQRSLYRDFFPGCTLYYI